MKINIHLGNSIKAMQSMQANKYGLGIVDPPYGINADLGIQKNDGKFGYKKHKSTNWDSSIPNETYFNELFRVSKDQIIWGANYFTKFIPASMCWIVWDKIQRNFSFSHAELAYTSFETKLQIFQYGRGNESGFAPKLKVKNGINIHPTQKPIALYKWLLKNYGFNKDGSKRTIFDSHGGSMSLVIACIDLGFDIDCWEVDEDYYTDAVNRVKRHLAQQDLTRELVDINYIKD